MPGQPPIEGFPIWAQILVSLFFGLAALAVAFRGYFVKEKSGGVEPGDKASASIMAASIVDMGAIRHLSDVITRLIGTVEQLNRSVEELTHHERNNIDVSREKCARLRELSEELKRQGSDARRWDQRNEERR